MKAICVLLVCFLVFTVASAEVKVLKSSDFDSTLKKADVALVKFYAPWCGHCKKLAPEFKKAADKLKGKVVLAEVNCDEEKELCGKHGVRGYPALNIFRNGEKAEDYNGGRTSPEIVKFMIANSGPAVTYVSTKAELDKIEPVDAKVLTMTASKDSALAKTVEKLAPSLRSGIAFATATDNAVAPDVAMESVVAFRPDGDSETFVVDGEVDKDALEAFLKNARIPMLGAVGPSTIQMYNELGNSNLGWLFVDKTNRAKVLEFATKVARANRKDLVMLWVDTELYGQVAEQLAVPKGSKFPAFVIDKSRKHHVHPLDAAVTEESLSAFIKKYLAGEVEPTIKSEPVPEKETVDGMTTIVGQRLRPIIEEGKDMMILFYAPWCGHCKTFHPVYDKVAKALENSDVVIAKMDATANDIDSDSMTVQGFPTIYFVKAGEKTPISYEGDRSYDDVLAFIKKNAKASVGAVDEADL